MSHLYVARLKKRLPPIKEEENSEWERFKDLKKYFYDSKFGGSNPEDQVYSFFKSKMGVTLKDWVSSFLSQFHYCVYTLN